MSSNSRGPPPLGPSVQIEWQKASEEISRVVAALHKGEPYLCMTNGTLAQYLLGLQEKENRLLQLLASKECLLDGSAAPGGVPPSAAEQPRASSVESQSITAPTKVYEEPISVESQAFPSTSEESSSSVSFPNRTGGCGACDAAKEDVFVQEGVSGEEEEECTGSPGEQPERRALVRLSVPGRNLSGVYEADTSADHHGALVYVKRPSPGTDGSTLYCYYWDSTEGPGEWRGWWIGTQVGGNRVSAFCKATAQEINPQERLLPPTKGWQIFGVTRAERCSRGEELLPPSPPADQR